MRRILHSNLFYYFHKFQIANAPNVDNQREKFLSQFVELYEDESEEDEAQEFKNKSRDLISYQEDKIS